MLATPISASGMSKPMAVARRAGGDRGRAEMVAVEVSDAGAIAHGDALTAEVVVACAGRAAPFVPVADERRHRRADGDLDQLAVAIVSEGGGRAPLHDGGQAVLHVPAL